MSSHREAPEISKDPVADSTDTYAFVSTNPAEAGTVTLITNYIPLEDPAGGPNFYEFGDDVLYRINVDNNGDGWPDVTLRVHVPDRVAQDQLPLQHRADRDARQRQLEPPPARQRHRGARHQPHGARRGPAAAAVQHRAALDAELRRPRRRGDVRPRRRGPLLRRPAPRRLLRRPRLGVRPRRPAAVPEPPPDPPAGEPDAGDRRVQRAAGVQRPHDRHPGADRAAHRRRHRADRPDGGRRPSSACGRRRTARRGATRDETTTTRSGPYTQVSRLGNPLVNEVLIPIDAEGRVEPVAAERRRPVQPSTSPAPSWPPCCPCCTPACSPTWPPSTPTGPTSLAILHTGIPDGLIPGFQNFTGTTQADMLRLNVAIPPNRQPEHQRDPRRRPRRLPERTPGVRQHRRHRAARRRRGHLPARRQHATRPTPRPGRSSTSSTPSCRGTSATSTPSRTSTIP